MKHFKNEDSKNTTFTFNWENLIISLKINLFARLGVTEKKHIMSLNTRNEYL